MVLEMKRKKGEKEKGKEGKKEKEEKRGKKEKRRKSAQMNTGSNFVHHIKCLETENKSSEKLQVLSLGRHLREN